MGVGGAEGASGVESDHDGEVDAAAAGNDSGHRDVWHRVVWNRNGGDDQGRRGATEAAFSACASGCGVGGGGSDAGRDCVWHDVAFTYQKMPMQGAIRFSTTCNPDCGCMSRDGLRWLRGLLNAAAIEGAIGRGGDGFFGQILTNALGERLSAWPSMAGEICCDGLELGQLMLRNVAASVSVEGNKLDVVPA